MKMTAMLALLFTAAIPTFAATPAATIAAIQAATRLTDIEEVRVLQNSRCYDCSTIELYGTAAGHAASVTVETSRVPTGKIRAKIVRQAR